MSRHLAVALVLGGLTIASPTAAQTAWRQIGVLQSESRNLSIGTGEARVVSAVRFRDIYTKDRGALDTAKMSILYPGWDRHSDVVIHYAITAQGIQQTDWWYGQNEENTALKGDTISTSLGVYDQKGKRRAKIPAELRALLGDGAQVVAAQSGNLDSDPEPEIAIVVAGPWNNVVRGALNNVSVFDRIDGAWKLLHVFELDGPRRAGPLEIRDITGDGYGDIIYRSFLEMQGYFLVEARIFSAHDGMPAAKLPVTFNPRTRKPDTAKP